MEKASHQTQRIRSSSQLANPFIPCNKTENKNSLFWLQWQVHQEHLYHCCLKWTKSNPIDAEDVMSQAMLKAWNEWQNYKGSVKHPKAWFTRIIYNFCIDLHRKNKREALRIEKLEPIKFEDNLVFYSRTECPESNILDRERQLYLQYKINSLPIRLRKPLVLYYYQEKSYQDIAKQLACSEDNIRKCVRAARLILRKHLIKYIAGEDDTPLYSLSPSFNLEIPSAEKSQAESNWESLIPTKSQDEEINYQVTVLCLESLPHHCYSSANPLGWR